MRGQDQGAPPGPPDPLPVSRAAPPGRRSLAERLHEIELRTGAASDVEPADPDARVTEEEGLANVQAAFPDATVQPND